MSEIPRGRARPFARVEHLGIVLQCHLDVNDVRIDPAVDLGVDGREIESDNLLKQLVPGSSVHLGKVELVG
jgi:hypothetical protein